MREVKKIYLLLLFLLGLVMLATNLLTAKMFSALNNQFTIWFVLLLLSFGIGWLSKKGFGLKSGIKIILSTIFIAVVISIIVVAIFRNSLDVSNSFIENIVNYSLRVTITGLFAFFGFTFAQIKFVEDKLTNSEGTNNNFVPSGNNESDLIIKEAKLKAEKILFDVGKKLKDVDSKKSRIEAQLKELIQTERELIRKYEQEDVVQENKD